MPREPKPPTIPQHYRLQVRVVEMAKTKASYFGLSMPQYISQLIVKDCETKEEGDQECQ